MNDKIYSFDEIKEIVKPIAEKYGVEEIYLFGSYARGEADAESDLDFLVYGGANFRKVLIFAIQEELYEAFGKEVDAFEICEVNNPSDFYTNIMRERRRVA